MDLHPLDPQASPTRLIIFALKAAVDFLPLPVLGMDFVGCSELINHGVVNWAGNRGIYPLQEERPGHHRAPGNHLVRRYAYLLIATTPARSARSWALLGARQRQVVPPRLPLARPVGWGADKAGRRKRLYDAPRTPPGRLLDTDALTQAQKTDLISYRNQLNPAAITRRIIELQDVLICLAKDKTDEHLPRPDPQHPARRPQGVRLRKVS